MTETRQIDLKINKLTKQQYDSITPNADELYFIIDDPGIDSADIIEALGYTPCRKIVVENPVLTAVSGLCTWTITNNIGSENVEVKIVTISTNAEVVGDIVATASTVTIQLVSENDIPAETYRAIIVG